MLRSIFIDNWQRKSIAIILSFIIWILVNHSITATKTLHNVPIKVINIPSGMTIEGISSDGTLGKTLSLTITGAKKDLDRINPKDVEVLINASGKGREWIVSVRKNNLISLNPSINLMTAISSISHPQLIIKLSPLATEKIKVFITRPIGTAPEGYRFIDVWPKVLTYTITGPEDIVNKIKSKGLKLTFNLNDITKKELTEIASSPQNLNHDEISFPVPESWKKLHIPYIDDSQIVVDSKNAQYLRIDFLKNVLIPLGQPIPINLYFPLKTLPKLNPQTLSLKANSIVQEKSGIYTLTVPLYAHNVSRQFVDAVRDHLQLTIIASEEKELPWSIQFINQPELEEKYISLAISEGLDRDLKSLSADLRDEYLRKRFRSYLYLFQVYISKNMPLNLDVSSEKNQVTITERSSS